MLTVVGHFSNKHHARISFQMIDERILELGEKGLLIFNLKRFFEILDGPFENQNRTFSRKPVQYYNYETFNGELTLHHKEESLSYQKEYRILLMTEDQNPVKVQLHGLKEISKVVDLRIEGKKRPTT